MTNRPGPRVPRRRGSTSISPPAACALARTAMGCAASRPAARRRGEGAVGGGKGKGGGGPVGGGGGAGGGGSGSGGPGGGGSGNGGGPGGGGPGTGGSPGTGGNGSGGGPGGIQDPDRFFSDNGPGGNGDRPANTTPVPPSHGPRPAPPATVLLVGVVGLQLVAPSRCRPR